MLKTGNTLADLLLLVVTFLPLIPVLLIFIRKEYGKEPLNFLAVICLLCFLKDFSTSTALTPQHSSLTDKLFSLLLLALIKVRRARGASPDLRDVPITTDVQQR